MPRQPRLSLDRSSSPRGSQSIMSGKGGVPVQKDNQAAKKHLAELRAQAKFVPMKTSEAASDLLNYTEANKADDFLMTRDGWNPYTDLGGQWWMCK
ncbi:hypothetical protein QR680_017779 [Steinernema hermaphroditum]|uniref:G protein gamma domain-containing protein n=1 Tax=Steinernema hermaphroditum TaxID=289476 RepID=A0AA39HFS3_9BILA|nr:hypothetical protein QR680_017779 [Steinernema hermaphroditum]